MGEPITHQDVYEFRTIVQEWYDEVIWGGTEAECDAFEDYCVEQNDWDCHLPSQWRTFRYSAARAANRPQVGDEGE